MLIRANQVRKQFNQSDIQVSDDVVAQEVDKMVKRCGSGNVKRLTAGLFYIALGNLVTSRD